MTGQATPALPLNASQEQISERLNQLLRSKHEPQDGQVAPAQAAQQPKPREPGVYFGMPMSDYHADPALGSSDIKRLLQAPAVYWWHSHMNPSRPTTPDSAAKVPGRALHALVLEGEEGFKRQFAVKPSKEDHPNALVTLDDLKAKLRTLCVPVTGTKEALTKRIRLKLPDVTLFDDILKIHQAVVERDRLEVITKEATREVRKAAAAITCNPHLARAFEGGVAEVSVFWIDEDGTPCKCRIDYLKPRAVIDLKGFSNPRERPVDVAIRLAIAEYRYDIQAQHYLDGYAALHRLAAQGRIFGKCPLNNGWHKRIVPPQDVLWTWVFHQLDGPPVSKGRELRPNSPVLNKTTRELAQAKALFRDHFARFGIDPWTDREPVREFSEDELVAWMLEGTEVL